MTRPAREIALCESDLPPTVQNLIRLAGWRATMALVREMTGARIYPPTSPRARWSDDAVARFERVAELTGQRAAERIYREYAGDVIEIPSCRGALTAARNRMLRADYDAGCTIEELCVRHGLSRRQVFTVLKGGDDATDPPRPANLGGQLGLF